MKKKIFTVISMIALVGMIACSSTPEPTKESAVEAAEKAISLAGKGTVLVNPKGGFFIEHNGKKYTLVNPDKLDKTLRVNKMNITFTGKAIGDALQIDGATRFVVAPIAETRSMTLK